MVDISSIAAGLAALSSASDIVKALRGLGKNIEQAEFRAQLLEVSEKLLDAREALLNAETENLELKQQLQELTQHQDIRSQVRIENNILVPINNEVSGYGKGPWCSNCFEVNNLLVTLHHQKVRGGFIDEKFKWKCPNCDATVDAPDLKES